MRHIPALMRPNETHHVYEYQAEITRIVDGDTVHARLDLGCEVRIDLTLRLAGIDAPEMSTAAGHEAKAWLTERLSDLHHPPLLVLTLKDRTEKYGRYLASLWDGDENINVEMIEAGHAVAYDGSGPR